MWRMMRSVPVSRHPALFGAAAGRGGKRRVTPKTLVESAESSDFASHAYHLRQRRKQADADHHNTGARTHVATMPFPLTLLTASPSKVSLDCGSIWMPTVPRNMPSTSGERRRRRRKRRRRKERGRTHQAGQKTVRQESVHAQQAPDRRRSRRCDWAGAVHTRRPAAAETGGGRRGEGRMGKSRLPSSQTITTTGRCNKNQPHPSRPRPCPRCSSSRGGAPPHSPGATRS